MEPHSPTSTPQTPQEEWQNALIHHIRGSYATKEQFATLQATLQATHTTLTAQQADLHTVGQQVANLTASVTQQQVLVSQQIEILTLSANQQVAQTVSVGQQLAALSQQMALLTAHLGSSPSLEGPTTSVVQATLETPPPRTHEPRGPWRRMGAAAHRPTPANL